MNLLPLLLRVNLWCDSSLLKLLHHIAMVILRRLHLSLLLQLVYFKFKLLDLSLQAIILFTYNIITSFYKHLLNIEMLALSTKSINIKIITSFTSFACRGLRSFGLTWCFIGAWPKSIKLHFKILMSLLQDAMLSLKSTNWALETISSLIALSKFLIKFFILTLFRF
jgi:hypothetical protein